MPLQIDRQYVEAAPFKALARVVAATAFEGRPLTARARFLNPLVRALIGAANGLPPLARVEAPLFVVGSGRSGTTWLARVLSLHPLVGYLDEPKALWHAAIPDEDLVGSYGDGPARLVLEAADATPRARRVLSRGYGLFLRVVGARRVLDKYPELVHRIGCVRALFPDAAFLLVVRPGADACRSVATWSARRGRGSGARRADWWGAAGRKWRVLVEQGAPLHADLAGAKDELLGLERDEDRAALEWLLAMRAGMAWARTDPEHVHLVRYDELVRAPRAVAGALLERLRLARSERVLAHAERTAEARGSGEPIALHPLLAAPFAATSRALEELDPTA